MRTILVLLAGVSVVVVSAAPAAVADTPLRQNGRIVFSTVDGMASMNPDGSGQWGLRFTRIGQGTPDWSPDGTKIALAGPDANGQSIFTMDPDGTNVRRLTGRGYANNPNWSPDGQRLAFDDGTEIYLVDSSGGNLKEVVPGSSPSWSPDGTFIAYEALVGENFDVFTVELGSGRVTRLTKEPGSDSQPDWSPTGDKIVFTSDRNGSFALFTMKPDGSAVAALSQDSSFDSEPAWSPDGTKIAFSRNSQIWVMQSDGSDSHPLAGSTWSANPAWQSLPPGPFGCTLWGTSANDLLVGTPGNDVICSFEGDDSLIGLEGNDTLRGNEGADWLAGGTGSDLLRGGAGDDLIDARDDGTDMLFGDLGFDTARVDGHRLDIARRSTENVAVSRNIAAWHPTSASNQEPTNPSVLAVDGRLDDYWSSGNYPPQWIEVDLLAATRIASLRVIAPDLPGGASVLVLARRPNSAAYELLHEFHGPTIFKQALAYTPKRPWRRIRYIRVQFPTVANLPLGWISLPELEVYTPKT
jgi:hypothetical protein